MDLWSLGVDGMKMIEGKPDYRRHTGLALNDPIYDMYYSWCSDNAVPILMHVADPEEFWHIDKINDFARKAGCDNGTAYSSPS